MRVGILYVLSGIGGSLSSSISLEKSISVGASGALFGFLGAMLSELIINWSNYANKVPYKFTLTSYHPCSSLLIKTIASKLSAF